MLLCGGLWGGLADRALRARARRRAQGVERVHPAHEQRQAHVVAAEAVLRLPLHLDYV